MLEKTFCSSPWFHIGVNYDGTFDTCRWSRGVKTEQTVRTQSLIQFYNSEQMKNLRQQLLMGQAPEQCVECHYQEQFGKLNGRIKQLNKSAIVLDDFALSTRSSPHYENFLYSLNNQGAANKDIVDLQIDLGNVCNSACIMCHPRASSRLELDYQKLATIEPTIFKQSSKYTSWTRDADAINKFVQEISELRNLRYIQFLGGETLYDPAFYEICDQLISSGITNLTIGTTTNGTIFNDKIEKYIKEFKDFHLGISIESITPLNDYVRWPSKIDSVLDNITKFLNLRVRYPSLYVSLRITPNIFTFFDLDKLFAFMIEHNVSAESCNLLQDPIYLRPELLPDDLRNQIVNKFEYLIDYYDLESNNVVNTRRNDLIQQTISNLAIEYYNFVKSYKPLDSVEHSRADMVKFLKAFESLRNNSILDYLPKYEEFLRNYGY